VKILSITLSMMLVCLSCVSVRADEKDVAAETPIDFNMTTIGPDSLVVEGDRLQVYLDRKLKSIGNASLHKDKQDISGDVIEYDMENDELHVIGNTKIETSGSTVTGSELNMKLNDSTGQMKDASLRLTPSAVPENSKKHSYILAGTGSDDSATGAEESLTRQNIEDRYSYEPKLKKRIGPSRGDAKTILFEGQNKKRLMDARYTTCAADSDDWYLKASELELDDYTKTATAKNARIEFMGVPFLYTPWISFSFLNQRKSGLLTPTVGTTSRSGFEVVTPYYFNISPNMDATVAPRYLSKRGVQLQGEFRYLGETYSGIDSLEYLPNDALTDNERYYANLQHQQSFGNGWSAAYHLEKVSDDEYFSDMSTRITVTSRVNLPQQGQVDYSGDVWSFNGLVQKFQTLNDNTLNNADFTPPYERMPQLTLNGTKDWDMVTTNLYSQWVSFDRDPNKPNRVATASGDLVTPVTGSRLTAYPSISMPMERPYGYITPKFGVHHTSYSLNNETYTLGNGPQQRYEDDSRDLPIFSIDSGLFFDRNMRVVKNSYTQTFEPRLFYVYIPYRDQSNLPVFDTAEADLNLGTLFLENQFTGNDRINNANQLSLAVTTRMIDNKTGEQRLAATLGQRFYFSDQKVGLPGEPLRTGNTSDIVAAATLRLLNHWNIDTAWQYNTDTSNTVKSNIGTRYNPEPGKVLNLSYRYTQDSLEQVNISGQWPLGRGWYSMGRWNYSLRENQPIEGLAGIEYDAGCWQARTVLQRVSTATADANYALFFQLELGGMASIGSNPMSLLERGIPGYTSSGLIPDSTSSQPSY
jgi:LPS-assembly protein